MWIRSLFRQTKSLFLVESWTDLLIQRLSSFSVPYWIICTVAGITTFFAKNNYIVHKATYEEIGTLNGVSTLSFYLSFSFLVGYGLYLLYVLENKIRPSLHNSIIYIQQKERNLNTTETKPAWIDKSLLVVKNLSILLILIYVSTTGIANYSYIVMILALALLSVGKNKNEPSNSASPAEVEHISFWTKLLRNEQIRVFLIELIINLLILFLIFQSLTSSSHN